MANDALYLIIANRPNGNMKINESIHFKNAFNLLHGPDQTEAVLR